MKIFRWIVGSLGVAALALPVAASAQDYETEYDTEYEGEQITYETQKKDAGTRGPSVQAQGGVISYPGQAAADLSPGAAWGVLVGLKPLPIVELELGYQGAAYQTDERLAGAQENVIENGGQAILKAAPRVGLAEPYVFGGYQLSRFNVYERTNSSGVVEDDTLSKIPVGVGFDLHVAENVLVGARGQYNFLISQEAFTNFDGARSADQLGATLQLGARF